MNENTPRATERERKIAPVGAAVSAAGPHDPEFATRRSDYERLAESLLTMIELEMERVVPRLDADLSSGTIHEEEGDQHLLANAINRHLFLACESVDWFTPEAMRLYVEMRLLTDEQSRSRASASQRGAQPPPAAPERGNETGQEEEHKQDLAALLSAVLRHPHTPPQLHRDIMDALCDLSTDAVDMSAPEFIARAIYGNAPAAASRFDAVADALVSLLNDPATPAALHDLLAQTVDEIKNSSEVLGEPEIESAVVAHGLRRIYGAAKEGGAK